MSNGDRPWLKSNRMMVNAEFTPSQIRLARIWASKESTCIDCGAPPYSPCRNLNDLREGISLENAKVNKYPHSRRVDYSKLEQALRDRGYNE